MYSRQETILFSTGVVLDKFLEEIKHTGSTSSNFCLSFFCEEYTRTTSELLGIKCSSFDVQGPVKPPILHFATGSMNLAHAFSDMSLRYPLSLTARRSFRTFWRFETHPFLKCKQLIPKFLAATFTLTPKDCVHNLNVH